LTRRFRSTLWRHRRALALLAAGSALLAVPGVLWAPTFLSTGALDPNDPVESERLLRNEPPTACGAATTALSAETGAFHFDRYRYRNDSGASQCVTVTLDPQACTQNTYLQSAAYSPSFSTADITLNYVGDIGNSPDSPKSYSFDVAPGATFDVTVNEVFVNALCNSYLLTVDGLNLGVPPSYVFGGSIGNADAVAPQRLTAASPHTDCAAAKAATLGGSDGYRYDRFLFRNTGSSASCVTVTIDPMTCTGALHSSVHGPTFNSSSPDASSLGDIGVSPTAPTSYSVNVPAGSDFEVVVNAVSAGATCPAYGVTVTGFDVVNRVPTAVLLGSFRASRSIHGVVVQWRAGAEASTLAYRLLRSGGGKPASWSPLLPARGGAGGRVYSWVDRAAPKGALQYRLQLVANTGARKWLGTATVR
jgi:hypothetical protein